jgi:hypothetical protein
VSTRRLLVPGLHPLAISGGHIYVIAGGEITCTARTWIVEHLDNSQRRHIIFMDRDEFLDHNARILQDLKLEEENPISDDGPF